MTGKDIVGRRARRWRAARADAANMRLQLLGALIAARSVTLESGSGDDDPALAESARQLRLLLHD